MSELLTISEHMTAEDIFVEMKMERQAFKGGFLLFEGITDNKRFGKFFDPNKTSQVICWGKLKLLDAFHLAEKSTLDGYLALVDADFDRIISTPIASENIVYSKYHDFDLDFAYTPALERYLNEMADDQKCAAIGNHEEVAAEISRTIRELSIVKLSNAQGKINEKINMIDWANFYDGEEFDTAKFTYKLLKYSTPKHEDIQNFLQKALHNQPQDLDCRQITNGHDFFKALGVCLGKRLGKRRKQQIESKEVECQFRLTIDDQDFRSLPIYNSICEWGKKFGQTILAEHLAS